MPSQTWNNTVNSNSDSTLTLAYDRVDSNGTNAVLVNPRFTLWMKSASWTDSNNYIDVGGSAIVDKRVHPVTGESAQPINNTRTWTNFSAELVPLSYGGTANASFSVTISGISWFNGDSSTNTYTLSCPMPAKAYSLPNPPGSFAGSRISDNRVDLSWTANYTGTNGATPWSGLRLDRWDNVSNAWTRIANLGWAATSYSDTTTVANRRYAYALWAYNSAGDSTHVHVDPIYTTPAAASGLTATKAVSDVTVAWTVNAPQATAQKVQESTDGGTTWADVSGTLAASATSWTHVAPSTLVPHRYRVVTTAGTLTATSTASNTVQLLAAPNAPTNLAPAVADTTEANPLTWRHNPVDGTAQASFQVQHRLLGAGTWTVVAAVTSTASSWTLPAGTYSNGQTVEWQVRTKGQHVDWSAYSATATVKMSTRPVFGWATPDASPTHDSSQLTATATYFDAESTALTGWRIRVKLAGALVASYEGSTTPIAATTSGLADGATYTWEGEARDGDGLWSDTETATKTIAYAPPDLPVVTVTWDRDTASAAIHVANPATSPAAILNEVYVDGVLVGDTVPGGSVTVRLPRLDGTSSVVVRAISATPSSIDTDPIALTPPSGDCGIHLNAGPGYLLHAALWRGSPTVDWSPGVDVVLDTFAGDVLPSPTFGPQESFSLGLSGTVWFDRAGSSRQAWESLVGAKSTVCYRDAIRTRFGVLTSLKFTEANARFGSVAVTFEESLTDAGALTERAAVLIEDPPGSGEYRLAATSTDVSILELLE